MPTVRIAQIPHPLRDRFALGDLPRIAPWVAQEISYAGTDTVRHRSPNAAMTPTSRN